LCDNNYNKLDKVQLEFISARLKLSVESRRPQVVDPVFYIGSTFDPDKLTVD